MRHFSKFFDQLLLLLSKSSSSSSSSSPWYQFSARAYRLSSTAIFILMALFLGEPVLVVSHRNLEKNIWDKCHRILIKFMEQIAFLSHNLWRKSTALSHLWHCYTQTNLLRRPFLSILLHLLPTNVPSVGTHEQVCTSKYITSYEKSPLQISALITTKQHGTTLVYY